jgi:hypothetical protein
MSRMTSDPRRFWRRVITRYISPFEIEPGQPVVLCLRESTIRQRAHFYSQGCELRDKVTRAGGEVVHELRHVGNGNACTWLAAGVEIARRHGAIYVGETTARYIRHWRYHPVHAPDRLPTLLDLDRLREVTGGLPLMTLLNPGATPAEIRNYETARSTKFKVLDQQALRVAVWQRLKTPPTR